MTRRQKWHWILPIALVAIAGILAGCPSPLEPGADGGGGGGGGSDPDPSPTTYSVVYDENEAESGTVPTDNTGYGAGDTVTVLANTGSLVRTGFTFVGWNTSADGSGTNYTGGSTFVIGDANITLYARWIADTTQTWTVSFDSNGGSAIGSQVVVDGEAATAPDPDPTRTGYSFDRWYADAGLASAWDFAAAISGDATLYAGWTANDYQIVFNANGGAGTMNDQTIAFGSSASLPVVGYSRSGYSFSGWNTQANGGGTAYADGSSFTMDVEGLTLYAQWSAAQVPSDVPAAAAGAIDGTAYGHLEFEYYGGDTSSGYNTDVYIYPDSAFDPEFYLWINDGSDSSAIDPGTYTLDQSGGPGSIEDVSILAGTDYAATVIDQATFESFAYSPTAYDQLTSGTVAVSVSGDTYTFEWTFNTSDGDTLAGSYVGPVDAGDIPVNPDITYSVTYAANGADGGSVPVDSVEYGNGDSATVLGNTGNLTRSGYTFEGWNTAANGGGTDYAAGDGLTVSADVTLYAQWSVVPTYSVTYDTNGADGGFGVVDSGTYEVGDTVTVLDNYASRTGYEFSGWNTEANGSGTLYQPGDQFTMASADVTLFAYWTIPADDNDIVYDGNGYTGGTLIADNANYGAGDTVTVAVSDQLSRAGDPQVAWNTAPDGSGTSYRGGDTFAYSGSQTTLYAHYLPLVDVVDPSFEAPDFSWGTFVLNSVAEQSTGKLVVAGLGDPNAADFSAEQHDIHRLNTDGSLDSAFASFGTYDDYWDDGTDYRPRDIDQVETINDRIFILGTFDSREAVRYSFGGMMLDENGQYDPAFTHAGTTAIGEYANLVGEVIVDSNGRLLMYDFFERYGTVDTALVRIAADGAVDTLFAYGEPSGSTIVSHVGLQSSGAIVIVESSVSSPDPVVRRLDADGTADTTFAQTTYPDGVKRMIVQDDDRILVVEGDSDLTLLASDGSVDSTFTDGVSSLGSIEDAVVLPDGRILMSGSLSYEGWSTNLWLVNSDGSLDLSLAPQSIFSDPFNEQATLHQASPGIVYAWDYSLDTLLRLDFTP